MFKPKKFQLNREHKRAYYLQTYAMFMLFFGLTYEVLLGIQSFDWAFILKFIFLGFIYNIYYKTFYKLDLYYWLFSFFIGCYFFWCLFASIVKTDNYILFYIYLTSNLAIWLKFYIMSSPIFFPRTLWWEYDFRYRSDLHIVVEVHSDSLVESFEGRMTDIRRAAACVVLFQDLPMRKKIFIKAKKQDQVIEIKAVILSRKEYLFGRGITYGVKLLLKSQEEKDLYKMFSKFYKEHHRKKLSSKFIHTNKEEVLAIES